MGKSAVKQKVVVEKRRSTLVKFLIIILPMWVSAKFYAGPYMELVRNYFAAILQIIMLGLIIQMIFVRMDEKRLLVILFAVLSLIQVVAVYLSPNLFPSLSYQVGQAHFFGGIYTLNLIPYYGVGGFIAYFILKQGRVDKTGG